MGFEFASINYLDAEITLQCFVYVVLFIMFFDAVVGVMEYFLEGSRLYNRMIQTIYKELMLMGLVSFTVAMIEAILRNKSVISNEMWINAIEFSHILLFFVTFFFVAHAFYLMRKSMLSRSEYRQLLAEKLSEIVESVDEALKGRVTEHLFYWNYLPLSHVRHRVEFHLAHALFRDTYCLPEDFHFADYISGCFDSFALKTIDRSFVTWIMLMILAVINFGRIKGGLAFNKCAVGRRLESLGPRNKGNLSMCEASAVDLYLVAAGALCVFAVLMVFVARLYKIRMLRRIGIDSTKDYIEFLKFARKEEERVERIKERYGANVLNQNEITNESLKDDIERVLDDHEHSIEENEFKYLADILASMANYFAEVTLSTVFFFKHAWSYVYTRGKVREQKILHRLQTVANAFENMGENEQAAGAGKSSMIAVSSKGPGFLRRGMSSKIMHNADSEPSKDDDIESNHAAVKQEDHGADNAQHTESRPGSIVKKPSAATDLKRRLTVSSSSIHNAVKPMLMKDLSEISENSDVEEGASSKESPLSASKESIVGFGKGHLDRGMMMSLESSQSVESPLRINSKESYVNPSPSFELPRMSSTVSQKGRQAGINQESVIEFLQNLELDDSSKKRILKNPTRSKSFRNKKQKQPKDKSKEDNKANANENRRGSVLDYFALPGMGGGSSESNHPEERRNSVQVVRPENRLSVVERFKQLRHKRHTKVDVNRWHCFCWDRVVSLWLYYCVPIYRSVKTSIKTSIASIKVHNDEDGTPEEGESSDVRLSEDFHQIYFLRSPRLFFGSVEAVILLNCLYMAFWVTDFIIISSHAHKPQTWHILTQLAMLIPFVFVLPCIGYISETASILWAISELNLEVIYGVLVEGEETKRLVSDVRAKMIDRITALESANQDKHKILRALFDEVDEDGTGSIDKLEFRFFLRVLKLTYSDDRFNQLFRAVDISGDGLINYDELVNLLFPTEEDKMRHRQALEKTKSRNRGASMEGEQLTQLDPRMSVRSIHYSDTDSDGEKEGEKDKDDENPHQLRRPSRSRSKSKSSVSDSSNESSPAVSPVASTRKTIRTPTKTPSGEILGVSRSSFSRAAPPAVDTLLEVENEDESTHTPTGGNSLKASPKMKSSSS